MRKYVRKNQYFLWKNHTCLQKQIQRIASNSLTPPELSQRTIQSPGTKISVPPAFHSRTLSFAINRECIVSSNLVRTLDTEFTPQIKNNPPGVHANWYPRKSGYQVGSKWVPKTISQFFEWYPPMGGYQVGSSPLQEKCDFLEWSPPIGGYQSPLAPRLKITKWGLSPHQPKGDPTPLVPTYASVRPIVDKHYL